METSREDLQSANEELTALNAQLRETLDLQRARADDLENILDSSGDATIVLDEKLDIRFFTPAARALFSVTATDVGRPLADLPRHFSAPDLLGDIRAVLADLAPIVREVHADNGAWYNSRLLPCRTRDDRIQGVVISFADISVVKRAEEMSNAAKQLAESANLGKSRFLAAASHDLRQPLQTLSLLQGLLAKNLEDPSALQLVARGDEALRAMAGMLNSILDINQLEAGVVRPELVDFPVDTLLDRLRAEFAYHTQAKGLALRVVPCRLAIHSDPRLLDQVIRNLLSNAVKYTSQGKVLLGCRRSGDRLRIEVWDTGVGIPNGQLRAIFEEFHQVANAARPPGGGLGLGLAIVERLGSLLGLAIDVRSVEGGGSVFTVAAPLAPRGAGLTPHPEGDPTDFAFRRGSILILEDDPAVREALELVLCAEGHEVTTAANGAEVIRLAQNRAFRPDLVIVDHNLPGDLSGLQVISRLRQAFGHDVSALVLTGDISADTLREIAAQGYLQRSKPVRADELSRLVRRLFAEHGAA